MISLVLGKNDYAAWQFVKKTKDEFSGDVLEIDAAEVELQEIKNSLESQSLFNIGGDKLVILNNASAGKLAIDYILEHIDSIDTELLIYDTSFDKRSGLYKKLKQADKVQEFGELNDQELISWLLDLAKEISAKLDRSTANYLINRVGKDQWLLMNELNKLSSYSKNITKENVDELTEKSIDETIFNMLDSLVLANKDKTLQIHDDLMAMGSDPIYIVTMLVWYFHNVAVVKTAKSTNDYDVAKQYKMSPYVVGKSRKVANRLSKQDLIDIFDLLIRADYQLKNENVNKKQLSQLLIIEICSLFE